MTDLERFIELYRSFDIDCIVYNNDIGNSVICLSEDDFESTMTTSTKFTGYGGFHTIIEFNPNGQFVSQGFWE